MKDRRVIEHPALTAAKQKAAKEKEIADRRARADKEYDEHCKYWEGLLASSNDFIAEYKAESLASFFIHLESKLKQLKEDLLRVTNAEKHRSE